MKLRFLVALVAACSLSAGACSKKADTPADPSAATDPATPADPAKTDETPKADEVKTDEVKTDEAPKVDEVATGKLDATGDPMKRALALQKKALELLKANKSDPKAAAAAIDAFHKENTVAIDALKTDLEAMSKQLKEDPSAAMEMFQKYTAELQEMQQLTMDLMKEAPELMSTPEVAAAMAKLSPSPDGGDDEGADDGGAVTDEGDDAVPAAKLSDADKALLEDALLAQEKMIEILSTNAATPDKAGDELSAYFDANKDKLTKLVDVQKRLQNDPTAAMEFAQKNMARITSIATKLSEIVKNNPALLTNEKVAAAMAKFNGGE
ncbi:MAG: hypothetical protein CVU56_13265 [Deltaproteobacteria bacterium HGW-Deltaproteobacteria-14]|jgi:hypothetical protein|nr:MAG: hypothetical protein CVU56_13265 [Deltaproteobacteria bacterium HGW-Deltaproteobacteria-14]